MTQQAPTQERVELLAALEEAVFRAQAPNMRGSSVEISRTHEACKEASIPEHLIAQAAARGRARAQRARNRWLEGLADLQELA